MQVDMVIIGSVAVNPANGARIGKGEGFAELEYGMLRLMGAVDDSTPVVSCIHDCQLVDDIHAEPRCQADFTQFEHLSSMSSVCLCGFTMFYRHCLHGVA